MNGRAASNVGTLSVDGGGNSSEAMDAVAASVAALAAVTGAGAGHADPPGAGPLGDADPLRDTDQLLRDADPLRERADDIAVLARCR